MGQKKSRSKKKNFTTELPTVSTEEKRDQTADMLKIANLENIILRTFVMSECIETIFIFHEFFEKNQLPMDIFQIIIQSFVPLMMEKKKIVTAKETGFSTEIKKFSYQELSTVHQIFPSSVSRIGDIEFSIMEQNFTLISIREITEKNLPKTDTVSVIRLLNHFRGYEGVFFSDYSISFPSNRLLYLEFILIPFLVFLNDFIYQKQ